MLRETNPFFPRSPLCLSLTVPVQFLPERDRARFYGSGLTLLAFFHIPVEAVREEYTHQESDGPKPDIGTLSRAFGCDSRQLVYYARRIAATLDKLTRER